MVIVFWKRCILSLRFPARFICLWTVSLFFLSEAVQFLMSLLLRSLPQPYFPPYSVLMEDPIQKSRFSRQSTEECIVILPVQGPLLTAVSPPGASTRPFSFYPHFLPHLPEFFVFLCSGYRLRQQDVLWCALLLSSLYSSSSRSTEASKAKFASLWSVALPVHLPALYWWEWPIHSLWTIGRPRLFLHPTLLLCCVILNDKVIIFRILLSVGLTQLSVGGRSKPFPRGLCG